MLKSSYEGAGSRRIERFADTGTAFSLLACNGVCVVVEGLSGDDPFGRRVVDGGGIAKASRNAVVIVSSLEGLLGVVGFETGFAVVGAVFSLS